MASRTPRAGGDVSGAFFQRYKNKTTPKNEAAFTKKDHPAPAAATTVPPIAGPTARATLNPAEFNATPDAWRPGETTSGVIACQAGSFITAPSPIRNVNAKSIHGLIECNRVSTPRAAA